MKKPDIPDNEEERIACLTSLDILDTPSEPLYDQVTQLASDILDVPISLVSIVDRNRQWFKSKVGLDADETHRDISFCGHVAYSNEPLIVADALEDERFADNPLVTSGPKIRFYAGLPIRLKDNVTVGTLCIIDTKPRQLTDEQLKRFKQLKTIVEEAFIAIRNALTDPLTNIFNRRMLDKIGNKLIAKSVRDNTTFACACIDIDYFKAINDQNGHDIGDKILFQFAEFLEANLRQSDYLFRVGGEEFCLLLPGTTSAEANIYCERLRNKLHDTTFMCGEVSTNITASFGVTEFLKQDISMDVMLKRADIALYDAKGAGRDTIVIS